MGLPRLTTWTLLILLLASSCGKTFRLSEGAETYTATTYINYFAYNNFLSYYLWVDEMEQEMSDWRMSEEPVEQVRSMRYVDATGRLVDRWTALYEDFDELYESVTGRGVSYGFEVKFKRVDPISSRIKAVITYTYADSPARKAGLKRGQNIMLLNGRAMNTQDYQQVYKKEVNDSEQLTLTLADGSEITLTPANMYEDPVLCSDIFYCAGGKKVGYIHYTSFNLESCGKLIEVCRDFKQQGVQDLILDMRYNGGGYAFTEDVLASMLAPEQDVLEGNLLSREVFNDMVSRRLGEQETHFQTAFSLVTEDRMYEYNTEGANLDISHLYAIVDSGSASATESLLCELYPYLDITLIGGKTHGKFCSGLMIRADQWYESNANVLGDMARGVNYVKGWGLYVMYSRFADKYGITRCMPDGLAPDVPVSDNPNDGFQLGDPRETMLATALALAGYTVEPVAKANSVPAPTPEWVPYERPTFRILGVESTTGQLRPANPESLR